MTTAVKPVPSPLKWHGGKSYLAKQIVSLMPPHLTYCEPFAGGLSVLLAKDPEGISEVANDLNNHLAAFWGVLANPNMFETFRRHVEAMPIGERLWIEAAEFLKQPATLDAQLEMAVAFFVVCRQSLAGRMESFGPLSRSRTRRGMNEQVSAWLTTVDGLPLVHQRLRRVAVLNRPAVKVINDLDHPETLFYCDPPYLKETHTATEVYRHEMSNDDHQELLNTLSRIKGKFILSGYPSELYDTFATRSGWTRIDIEIDNKAAGGETKRKMTECLWMNFEPHAK